MEVALWIACDPDISRFHFILSSNKKKKNIVTKRM